MAAAAGWGLYLFNIGIPASWSPAACYFHWAGASASFLRAVRNLEHVSAIAFHSRISKMRRGKHPKRCLAQGSVLCSHNLPRSQG